MIEKPNKDGKPPTVEYQEEEILVSAERCSSASLFSFTKYFEVKLSLTIPSCLCRTLFMVQW